MPELVYRIVGIVLFIPYIQVRKSWQRRIRAHLQEKPVLERGALRERVVLGVYAVLTLPLFGWFLTPWLDGAAIGLPDAVRWVGAAVTAAGVWYFWRTHVALAENWAPVLEVREGHRLVTSGPYRLVRHPMYSAAFVIALGLSMLSSNWSVTAGLLLGMALLYNVRVRDEEQLMIDAFGDEYRDYMRRTGRLVPRLGGLFGAS